MFVRAFFIVSVIFSIDFSFEARLNDGERKLVDDSEDSKQVKKKSDVIKKAELDDLLLLKQEYLVKNYIDEYETHFAVHFTPVWSKVDRFSSPARQSVEVRRQRWNFIFDTLADTVFVKRLDEELKKANLTRAAFCTNIAEIYSLLSDNNFIFSKDRTSDKNVRTNPTQEKSIQVLMGAISHFKPDQDKDVDNVQLPKSLYIDLMRKDAHAAIMKQHHEEKIQRLKDAYRKKIQRARDDNEFVDSEISSY